MKHYTFTNSFRALYDKALGLYQTGQRGADTFFLPEERAWLAANGITPQHLYDYAEDHVGGGEPGYDNALAIEVVRRDYFLNVQNGRSSGRMLDEKTLPAKDAQVLGIAWLPRILPKARAKLRGELPASLMYSCGGDRKFLKNNDILPAEFLSVVWRHEQDDAAVIDWVAARAKAR